MINNIILYSSEITGKVLAPPSKSLMQRACAIALLTHGDTLIQHYGSSNDDKVAIQIIQNLGATIEYKHQDEILIQSKGIFPKTKNIFCGESGLSCRMFLPIMSTQKEQFIISGEGSLLERKMPFWEKYLPLLNVQFKSNNGHIPFSVEGGLQPKLLQITESDSSQYITGLLMAYAYSGITGKILHIQHLKSIPYIDITVNMLQQAGIEMEHTDYTDFYIRGGQFTPTTFPIEGDYSGASLLLVAGCIAGDITIKNLYKNSLQADKKIINALWQAHADVEIREDEIYCKRSDLQSFKFDATHCPDIFPALALLACFCKGNTMLQGVKRLYNKESNRAESITQELNKMGAKVSYHDDEMSIEGVDILQGVEVSSHKDHRIAMMCAVAALRAQGNTIITDADAVNKSFPSFYEVLQSVRIK
ncbi:MAG: 3-phosphoshikimate 1-carboxyvinyltransferase [Chitinophagaceae bacterium]